MAVSIPKRWRPQITRGGPGIYRVSWVGMPVCTCHTRSDAKIIVRHLAGLLRPLARSSHLNLGGVSAAIYVWLLAASIPESGILPQVNAAGAPVIPRPITVQQRVALPLNVAPGTKAVRRELFNIIDGPAGPELARVAPPEGPDTSSSGEGGEFLSPVQAILNDIRIHLLESPPEATIWQRIRGKLNPPFGG